MIHPSCEMPSCRGESRRSFQRFTAEIEQMLNEEEVIVNHATVT